LPRKRQYFASETAFILKISTISFFKVLFERTREDKRRKEKNRRGREESKKITAVLPLRTERP
jgi:hypothetical protein